MKTTLISIISEQAIPNVQLALEFKDIIDKHIFVTTKKMVHKVKHIVNALDLSDNQYYEVLIDETSIDTIKIGLSEYSDLYKLFDRIIVNYTCGTKLLSMAIFNYFNAFENTECYYVNLNNTYQNSQGVNCSFSINLSVSQYLKACGLESRNSEYLHDKETADKMFDLIVNNKINNIVSILRAYRNINQKKIDIRGLISGCEIEILNIYDVLKNDTGIISKKDIKYITGDWFEEFCAYQIGEQFSLSKNDVWVGTNLNQPLYKTETRYKNSIDNYVSDDNILMEFDKLKKEQEQNTNELDIIFIYKNKLYVIECKTDLLDNHRLILDETIYKLDSIKQKFGLYPISTIVTLFNTEKYIKEYKPVGKEYTLIGNLKRIISNINRANNANIKILDFNFFNSKQTFKNQLC